MEYINNRGCSYRHGNAWFTQSQADGATIHIRETTTHAFPIESSSLEVPFAVSSSITATCSNLTEQIDNFEWYLFRTTYFV